MISGKTQIAAAAAVLALSASVSAAPALEARGAGMSRVAKVGGDIASDVAHRKTVGYVNDKIREHTGQPKVHPGLAEAARQSTKHHDQATVAAALGKHHKKRELEDVLDELIARGAGMSRIAKVGGDVAADMAHRGVVNAVNDKVKEHLGVNHPTVHPGLAEAARLANKPHHPDLVAAAIGKHHKKRELEEALEELMARGAGMSRVAKVGGDIASDVAHRKTVGYVNDKIREHTGQPKVHPGLAEAARQSTKHHDQATVAAALGKHHKKRELEDVLDELIARGAGMSRVAKVGGDIASDVAHRKTVGYVNDKIREHTGQPKVHPGLAEAARQSTKHHDQKLVDHVVSSHGRKKRDLEAEFDDLFAREFDDEVEELFARGAGMSRVAKVGGDIASDVAHRKTVGYVNDKIREHSGQPKVHPGLVEAAKQHTKHHDPAVVAAATSHGRRKRDLASALMDYVEARSFELDDLE